MTTTTWNGARRGAVVTALLLLLLCTMLFAGAAMASAAVPSRPTAKAPTGTVRSSWVKFTWTKALRATSYQVRIYRGDVVRHVEAEGRRITGLSWTYSGLEDYYNDNIIYTWQVRGRNGSGYGRWSKLLPHFHIDNALWATWNYALSDSEGSLTNSGALTIRDDQTRTYKRTIWSGVPPVLGTVTERGNWRATGTTIKFTNRLRTWVPDPGDESGVKAYKNKPRADLLQSYVLGDWEYSYGLEKMCFKSVTVTGADGAGQKYWRYVGGVTD